MRAVLKVTSKGQITLRKELLEHLGVRPGERVEIDLAPGRRLQLRPERKGRPEDWFGMLASPGQKALSLEEIKRAAEQGWAGRR